MSPLAVATSTQAVASLLRLLLRHKSFEKLITKRIFSWFAAQPGGYSGDEIDRFLHVIG